jgi:phosphatidylserine/phosphatidylglycerophosphate/cardiolipin synthase-like enzyme
MVRRNFYILSILLFSLAVLASACVPTPTPQPLPTLPSNGDSSTATPSGDVLPWLQVFFTKPNPPDNQAHGIDNYVVPLIDGAKSTIDVASFDFNLPSVTNALVNAKNRGVKVRVVVDEVNGNQELDAIKSAGVDAFDALKALQDAKIPVTDGGRSNGLMHDKIIIVDGTTLLMGSWNMSYNDTFRNNNNLLEITNPDLIANYQAKLNELFKGKHFGAKAQVGAIKPKLTIDGVQVENYFSPVDNVMDKLVAYVNAAQKSVRFIAFTYTDHRLSDAMIARAKAGVTVEGIIENRGASQGALVPLVCAKLPVKVDGNKYTMHHKVIVIDDNTVITGSFNFTNSADTANDDNILAIHSPEIAALYNQEFERLNGIAATPPDSEIDCSKVK